jgi:glycosyltransferase involved in cell wall biosynthesis
VAKNVLIYTNHYFPENFKVNEIADILVDNGFKVHVITGLPNYPSGKVFEGYGLFDRKVAEKSKNLKVTRLPLIPRGSGSKYRLILNYLSFFSSNLVYTIYLTLRRRKYDYILVHHTSPILVAVPPLMYKAFYGPKSILWDLDMWPDTLVAMGIVQSKRAIDFLEKIVAKVYKSYDYIFLGSENFFEKAEKRVEGAKLKYFPNWAEKEFFQAPIEVNGVSFPTGFNILYAGNIGKAQDFESVLETMRILRNEKINWLIVGDGRDRENLEEKVKKENMESKVIFFGNRPLCQIPFFYSKADALFLSLKDEKIFHQTVPAKLQTYMTSGKPILAMLSGEGARIIDNSNCGFSVESGDYIGFSKIILTAKNLPESQLRSLGENGKKFYSNFYDIEKRKKQLFEIFK